MLVIGRPTYIIAIYYKILLFKAIMKTWKAAHQHACIAQLPIICIGDSCNSGTKVKLKNLRVQISRTGVFVGKTGNHTSVAHTT